LGKLILVIEDDDAIRELISDVLKDAGYSTSDAEDGARALELLATVTFDLITLDSSMPKMDGNKFLEQLVEQVPTIPVIVISALPGQIKPHPQVKARIAKPFDMEQLLAVIEKYIN
jgi:CheY-like chemotaxis protein